MEKNELGTPEQSVPVTPAATTPAEADDMEIHLVWSESGLYLVSAQSPEEGWSHRLTGDDMPVFELGPEAGSLEVDEAAFQVQLKYADETRLMIHRAQLLESGTAEREFHPKARHIESPTLPARVWLSAHLEEARTCSPGCPPIPRPWWRTGLTLSCTSC